MPNGLRARILQYKDVIRLRIEVGVIDAFGKVDQR